MEEKNQSKKKIGKLPFISLLCSIIGGLFFVFSSSSPWENLGSFLSTVGPLLMVVSPFLGIASLIFTIKNKEKLKFKSALSSSVLSILLGSFAFYAVVISISISHPSPSKDARIIANLYRLREVAEIHYYYNNDSYTGFEKKQETDELRNEIVEKGGTNFTINVSSNGKQYCAEVLTNFSGWYCVDSLGGLKDYTDNPECSNSYFFCE